MKKILSIFGILCALNAQSQDKIYIHLDDGYSVEFDLSKIDSISYEKRHFNVKPIEKPDGKLPGKFSVSDTTTISFSMGNLQYQASTSTWRFAENQYDIVGDNNSKISSANSEWIDLYGWGTSGYDEKNPYLFKSSYNDYKIDLSDIEGSEYDWGVHNDISNGGEKAGMWRTLTNAEWTYLFTKRENANKLYFNATINGVRGKVVLPDDCQLPEYLKNPENDLAEYDVDIWNVLESKGAVFLPYSGYRTDRNIKDLGVTGTYWSSTKSSTYIPYSIYMTNDVSTGYSYAYCYFGLSVRLVQNIDK